MAVMTYNWVSAGPSALLSEPATSVGLTSLAIASNAAGTRFFATWNSAGNESVMGRVLSADGTLISGENVLNSTGAGQQFDSSVAGLNNGNFVVSYTDLSADPPGDIRFRLFNAAGVPLADDVNVVADGSKDRNSDVAALSNGGFAIAFDRDFGSGDFDIKVQLYHANGTANGSTVTVNSAGALNTNTPSVTGLAGGGFVVGWTQQDAAGANPTGVWFQRYTASGVAQGGHVFIPNETPADSIQVQALLDGGFVVAYRSEANNISFAKIYAQVFNADGTARSTPQVAASDVFDISPPEITCLSNDFFLVTTEGGTVFGRSGRAFDADGNAVGGDLFSGSVASALAGGLVASIRDASTDFPYPEAAVRSFVDALVRTTTGGAGPEVLAGDDLRDVIRSGGSADTLLGLDGDDTLDGGTGADRMEGGAGNDVYYADEAGDRAIELAGQGYDTVNTVFATHTLAANVERVNYTGTGAFTGIGNALANRFQGAGGDDRFIDVLGGADIFSGGLGADTMDFRASATGAVINFATNVHGGAAAGDTFSSMEKIFGSNTAGDTMTAGTGRVDFSGFGGNDTLAGGISVDKLLGGDGNDTLNGGANNDTIQGGKGNDTLTGAAGRDLFNYVETVAMGGFGHDTITDFQDGLDRIKIDTPGVAAGFGSFTIAGNSTATVIVTLTTVPANFLTLQSARGNMTITAADFLFF